MGGIVGFVIKGQISQIDICSAKEANTGLILCGANFVGGLVGYVYTTLTLSGDLKVHISGHKKFINQDENEIEEMVYTSYVSEASINQIQGMVFSEEQRFGMFVGYATPSIVKYESAAIGVSADGVFIYYADHKVSAPKTFTIALNGNGEGVYAGSGIKIIFKNLSTGAEYTN